MTSTQSEKFRFPIRIAARPYLMDHTFDGKTVFPAVEAMQALAGSVSEHFPNADTGNLADARFDKFLHIDPDSDGTDAIHEMATGETDAVSKLVTIFQTKKSAIRRTVEHVSLRFPKSAETLQPPPVDTLAALEGLCFEVDSEDLYRDLVPFGPAYRNLTGKIRLSEKGAIATIKTPGLDAPVWPLGSPFPLDAAFHAACAWGQRFFGMVGFPMGFDRRKIFKPTVPGESYIAKIIPTDPSPPALMFDIWICDHSGNTREAILGVAMKDPSGGRMQPPDWIIQADEEKNRFENLAAHCLDFCVMELETLAPFAEKAMSDRELARTAKMLDRRKRSYFSARLVCKTLSRRLSGNDTAAPGHLIDTVRPDGIRPCCPLTDGTAPYTCSVSHDSRFAFAAASDGDIGVDVERISERVLKSRHYYMNESETKVAEDSDLDEIGACTRIWSIKECAAKILNIGLGRTWTRVFADKIGPDRSRFLLDGSVYTAHHASVDDHLFTLVNMPIPDK